MGSLLVIKIIGGVLVAIVVDVVILYNTVKEVSLGRC